MKIGVIAAMEEELLPLERWLSTTSELPCSPRPLRAGFAHGHELFLVRTDPGKVNAALATQSLLERHRPDLLWNLGSSGALDESLAVGDLVVGRTFVQHDFDLGPFGLAPGELLFDLVMRDEAGAMTFRKVSSFPADEKLSGRLSESILRCLDRGVLERPDGTKLRYAEGTLASGDQFISDRDRAVALRRTHGALATDMEAAAIAQVAAVASVPFLCLRAVSDRADHGAPVSFATFLRRATENYGHVFGDFLEALSRG